MYSMEMLLSRETRTIQGENRLHKVREVYNSEYRCHRNSQKCEEIIQNEHDVNRHLIYLEGTVCEH